LTLTFVAGAGWRWCYFYEPIDQAGEGKRYCNDLSVKSDDRWRIIADPGLMTMKQFLIVAQALAGFAILALGWLGWQLLRQNGRILLRLDDLEKRLDELEFGSADQPEGLPLGSDAPAFELTDLAGGRKALAQFRGQPMLLIFFNPECGFCREMMPKLATFSAGSTGHWPTAIEAR